MTEKAESVPVLCVTIIILVVMVTLNTYTGNTLFVTLTSDHLMYWNAFNHC